MLRNLVGPNYNIIGFDPRGVLYSEPNIDCFNGNRAAMSAWAVTLGAESVNSEDGFNLVYESAKGYGEFCKQALDESAGYTATPAVARDMITFTEAQAIARGEDPSEAKVNYYGISYGSHLGATFATLFPDRVGRLAIDAIGDGADYYGGEWLTSMWDTDQAAKVFFHYCSKAGSDGCAFYEPSVEEVEARFRKLDTTMRSNPIYVSDAGLFETPQVLKYGAFIATFVKQLYYPDSWVELAKSLVDIENRNGTSMMTSLGAGSICYECDNVELPMYLKPLSQIAVECIDADGRHNLTTKEMFRDHVDLITSMSTYGGSLWAYGGLICTHYPFKTAESQKFDGKSRLHSRFWDKNILTTLDQANMEQRPHRQSSLWPTQSIQ